MRRRRARDEEVIALRDHLERLERRLEDVEDTMAAALHPGRLDHLAERVDDLAMTTVTHDDLLAVRLHGARVAAELTRVGTELRAEQARLHDVLADHLAGRDQAATG